MAEGSLKPYDVTTESGAQTTLLLSDEDAKARGLVADKEAERPRNKARGASTKAQA